MADAHGFVASSPGAGLVYRGRHAGRDLLVRLTPRRGERVAQLPPEPRVPPGAVARTYPLALEEVGRLDQVRVGVDLQVVTGGDRCGGLLRTVRRGGDDGDDVAGGRRVSRRLGLPNSFVGQPESGQSPVEHAVGVVHLAVADQVNAGLFGHQGVLSWAAVAALRAARGKASAIRSNAASSRAAETNHASKALQGGETPPSSSAWKNGAKRHVSLARADAKSVTG